MPIFSHVQQPDHGLISQADQKYRQSSHAVSLRCLVTCTDWRLEVVKVAEDHSHREFLGEFCDPTVSYKHCSESDKADLIDMLV